MYEDIEKIKETADIKKKIDAIVDNCRVITLPGPRAGLRAGDLPGHPFRGNQYEDGGGSEPRSWLDRFRVSPPRLAWAMTTHSTTAVDKAGNKYSVIRHPGGFNRPEKFTVEINRRDIGKFFNTENDAMRAADQEALRLGRDDKTRRGDVDMRHVLNDALANRDLRAGGPGSGEPEGHPFRGNQHSSGSGGGHKFDGKYLWFPDGEVTSFPRAGEGALEFSDRSSSMRVTQKRDGSIYADVDNRYDRTWKSASAFADWLNGEGKKFKMIGVDIDAMKLRAGGPGSGEPEGHPFRGNQYADGTDGANDSPTADMKSVLTTGVTYKVTEAYGIKPSDQRVLDRMLSESRLMTQRSDLSRNEQLTMQVRESDPRRGVGIGDVVIPKSGAFKGMPMRCVGFGGRNMRIGLVPGFGVGPSGKTDYIVADLFRKDGTNIGVRINLPHSDRK